MDFLVLAVGVVLALGGGELFVRGAVGIADRLRIPPGVIGATVAAFATSSPELAVAISSAREDRSAVAVGDALGSNIVNVALVLGLAAIVAPLVLDQVELRRNLPFALAAPLLTGALAWDGELSRIDGTLLLVVFAVWLTRTAMHARRSRAAIEVIEEVRTGRAVAEAAVGLLLLIGAGQSIVWAAKGIGDRLGLDEFVVGATLVAIGTSTPELATTIISRVRGHDEVGVGTVLGSNIFNNLWIVGVATVISPAAISLGEVAVAIVAGVAVTLLLVAGRGLLRRPLGIALAGSYAGYVVVLLATSG